MEIARFDQLVHVLQDHLGLDQVEPPGSGEDLFGFEFDYHGMKISLLLTSEEADARLLVYCDFGAPEKKRELHALRKLMEINLFLGYESNSAFGRDADTGAITFRFDHALPIRDIDGFVGTLDHIAAQAAQWRRDFYLDDESEDVPGFSAFQFA